MQKIKVSICIEFLSLSQIFLSINQICLNGVVVNKHFVVRKECVQNNVCKKIFIK